MSSVSLCCIYCSIKITFSRNTCRPRFSWNSYLIQANTSKTQKIFLFFTSSTYSPNYFPVPIISSLPPLSVHSVQIMDIEHLLITPGSVLCVCLCLIPRSLSTSRLSDMVLKGAFGAHLLENRSDESLNSEKSLDGKKKPQNHSCQSTHFFSIIKHHTAVCVYSC